MSDIQVRQFNAVHDKIICDEGVTQELYDYLTFQVPNFVFMKRKNPKLKGWDGNVHLFSNRSRKVYVGLRERLEVFAHDRELSIEFEGDGDTSFSALEAKTFIDCLNLPADKYPRDYQIKTFIKAVRKRRLLILSPTGSGKSLILYLLIRYLLKDHFWMHLDGGWSEKPSVGPKKILLIVPTLNLIHQMASDFKEYGWNIDNIHLIYEGQEKTASDSKPLYISTWQSIYDQPVDYFKVFDAIMVDEAHHAQAQSIKSVMEMAEYTRWRYGCTGTLNDTLTHRLVLEGLFGPVYQATTTKELMDRDYLAKLNIKAIVLKYDSATAKIGSKLDYAGEIQMLSLHKARNNFLKNLTLSLDGNILLLFRLVDMHGKILYNQIKTGTNRPVFFIYGGVPGEEREEIRHIVQEQNDAILIGSYGTVSTGINWPSLRYVIAASPYKSRIKVLQSIGRGLRKDTNKFNCTWYDIADDLSYNGHANVTLRHYMERIRIYNEEEFEYRTYRVNLI